MLNAEGYQWTSIEEDKGDIYIGKWNCVTDRASLERYKQYNRGYERGN